MISFSENDTNEAYLSVNLQRIMAREKLTYEQVVSSSGLDERTIRAIARRRSRPHAATVTKLAGGLGVKVDELFEPVGVMPEFRFDKATNTIIEVVKQRRPELFKGWDDAQWRELGSRVGTGGALTEYGVIEAAIRMNENGELHRQAATVLESGDRMLLAEIVRMMYRRGMVRAATV